MGTRLFVWFVLVLGLLAHSQVWHNSNSVFWYALTVVLAAVWTISNERAKVAGGLLLLSAGVFLVTVFAPGLADSVEQKCNSMMRSALDDPGSAVHHYLYRWIPVNEAKTEVVAPADRVGIDYVGGGKAGPRHPQRCEVESWYK